MKTRLQDYENTPPRIVFEWHDSETEARGWAVLNSLRGGAAGGGTRMRKGLDLNEVVSLAKTMEIKFTVSGPAIGGAKSGIDFDPADPRKEGVLRRWFAAVTPLLRSYYGTGGDMNVDEVHEVIPYTEASGLWHPQEGIVNGHFRPDDRGRIQKVGQLRLGVSKVVEDATYAPAKAAKLVVADLITGFGVAEAVRHFYEIYGGAPAGKRAIIQGWGNVGAAAALYLARAGVRIVGVIDRAGGVLNPEGYSLEEIEQLFAAKRGNTLVSDEMLSFEEVNARIWSMGAEIFAPCAASRLVTRAQVDAMADAGLEVISSGANVPFADDEIFYGGIYAHADARVAVVPDFIANCGMARVFAYLQDRDVEISDAAIFGDVSTVVRDALVACHGARAAKTRLAETALSLALDKVHAAAPMALSA